MSQAQAGCSVNNECSANKCVPNTPDTHFIMMEPENVCRRLDAVPHRTGEIDGAPFVYVQIRSPDNVSSRHWHGIGVNRIRRNGNESIYGSPEQSNGLLAFLAYPQLPS